MPAKRTRVPFACEECGCLSTIKPSDVRKGGGRFCSHRCRYAFGKRPNIIRQRFFSKVDKGNRPEDCWVWTAALFTETGGRGGYGKFSLNRQVMTASKASWIIHNGPVPDGLFVCHNCPSGDNRRCVRPDHLFLGTAKQNSEDMVAKGRSAIGNRNGSRTHPESYPAKASSIASASRSF